MGNTRDLNRFQVIKACECCLKELLLYRLESRYRTSHMGGPFWLLSISFRDLVNKFEG